MKTSKPVAIIGAGPYGLSLAAHLDKKRIPFRIFGRPMEVWRQQMPVGMYLKSDGFASDLYDPDRVHTLKQFCADRRMKYADYGLPVLLDTFVAYALEFQRKLVPMLETKMVAEVSKATEGYSLRLEDGETLTAGAVVIATGISYFGYVPPPLNSLPPSLCAHSSAHHDLSGFRNRRVLVVGGGASATDIAALLHQAGADVSVVARKPVKFHLPPGAKSPSLLNRLRHPNLGLGPSLRSAAYTVFPGVFHELPRGWRQRIVQRHLGPAGGWFIKDQLLGKVQVHSGYTIQTATAVGDGASVRVVSDHAPPLTIEADHIIAATGYRVSVARLGILSQPLRDEVKVEDGSPALSRNFESSTSGLYFIGVASANNFGPLMRFARGAEYAANRLAKRLERVVGRQKAARSTATATA